MRIIFYILFLFLSPFAFSQIQASETSVDFGDLYPNMQTYADFEFTNTQDKSQFLLKIDRPREVNYVFSGKTMEPGESITVRLKINDGIKGKFKYEVDLHFSGSDKPITITLTGNVKEVASNPMTACPDFNQSPPKNGGYEFGITIKVIDSLTGEPLRRAKVYLVRSNSLVGEYYTNKDGIVHKDVPMGYYFITGEKDTYTNNHREGYLNFQRNYVVIPLNRGDEEPEIIVEVPEEIDPPEEEETPEIVIDLNEEPEVVEEVPEVDTVVVEEEPVLTDTRTFEELPDTLFDHGHFKKNNITFILDVSSSMNSSGKLDLLKLSMVELVQFLRETDLVSVIQYSSNVSVVVEGLSGLDKETIIDRVNGLRTSSSTAGGDAIKVAYRMNRKIYSPERNNIVIMITDGAFNKGSKDYLEVIEQNYRERGIIFSVVGIKTSPYLTEYMGNVVSEGGGDFIEIRTVEDAKTKIIREIRRTSFRGRSID